MTAPRTGGGENELDELRAECKRLRDALAREQKKFANAVEEARKWNAAFEQAAEDPTFVWVDRVDEQKFRNHELMRRTNRLAARVGALESERHGMLARVNGQPLHVAIGNEKNADRVSAIERGWHDMDRAVLAALETEGVQRSVGRVAFGDALRAKR